MDDSVHVEVEVVYFWVYRFFIRNVVFLAVDNYIRVSHAEPFKKCRNSHGLFAWGCVVEGSRYTLNNFVF